ncbi:MAG: hypothetical protein QXS27_04620 [Candidatus Jordarchaeaceae archaeon]
MEPFIQALRDDCDWCIRSHVAEVLGEIGDRRAIEPLIDVVYYGGGVD